jgi:hypothetical protein
LPQQQQQQQQQQQPSYVVADGDSGSIHSSSRSRSGGVE